MLHIIKSLAGLQRAINYHANSDDLVLIEEASYAASVRDQHHQLLLPILKTNNLFALEHDVLARGINRYVADQIAMINHHGLVDLTVKHANILTWD